MADYGWLWNMRKWSHRAIERLHSSTMANLLQLFWSSDMAWECPAASWNCWESAISMSPAGSCSICEWYENPKCWAGPNESSQSWCRSCKLSGFPTGTGLHVRKWWCFHLCERLLVFLTRSVRPQWSCPQMGVHFVWLSDSTSSFQRAGSLRSQRLSGWKPDEHTLTASQYDSHSEWSASKRRKGSLATARKSLTWDTELALRTAFEELHHLCHFDHGLRPPHPSNECQGWTPDSTPMAHAMDRKPWMNNWKPEGPRPCSDTWPSPPPRDPMQRHTAAVPEIHEKQTWLTAWWRGPLSWKP